MFLHLRFGGYHRAALAALDKAAQWTDAKLFPFLPPAPPHHRLHVVKKFL
jgi:hypothetical protein